MARKNTVYGAYHSDFGKEIERMRTMLINMGMHDVTKLEITALIAEKNKRAVMNDKEVVGFFVKLRGIK